MAGRHHCLSSATEHILQLKLCGEVSFLGCLLLGEARDPNHQSPGGVNANVSCLLRMSTTALFPLPGFELPQVVCSIWCLSYPSASNHLAAEHKFKAMSQSAWTSQLSANIQRSKNLWQTLLLLAQQIRVWSCNHDKTLPIPSISTVLLPHSLIEDVSTHLIPGSIDRKL